jgi:two-component system, sensor histidine kinase
MPRSRPPSLRARAVSTAPAAPALRAGTHPLAAEEISPGVILEEAHVSALGARRRAEARLSAQHEVIRILAHAGTLEEASAQVLEALGACVEADLGEIWTVDDTGQGLACRAIWRAPGRDQLGTFEQRSRSTRFNAGVGLPGRVWKDRRPAVIPELAADDNFPRVAAAIEVGLTSGFAFPIAHGDACFGAIEFFTLRRHQPDPLLLDMLTAIGRDIAQYIGRRRAEDEVQRLNHDLAKRLVELQTLTQSLESAARHKDEFLAILSHELRNPLAPLRSCLEILRSPDADDHERSRACQRMDRQIAHLARLLDDLLEVSRIATGKVLLRRDRIDLAALVRQVIEDHAETLMDGGLTIEIDVPSDPIEVHGDSTRLAQAIANLLQNADKFTDPGGCVIVRLRANAGRAELVVRDTGIGMTPEVLARAFQPFNQGQQGLDRNRGGLGLGLSVVKRLIELHGGEVTADSPGIGCGATFMLHLPLGEPADDGPRIASRPPDATPGAACRVLIIEDNRDSADSLVTLLRIKGHAAEVTYDGESALRVARLFRPAVVLCDIGLPGELDGYAVAQAMRADPDLERVRLIAMTGYGQCEDRKRSEEAGFDAHVTKPADLGVILALLAGEPATG